MDVLPRKRYDPNELVGCPYDIVHRVRISRLPYHLLKCAKQHPEEGVFEVCPYNARHVLPKEELSAHFSMCPDKPLMEDFRPVQRGKTALPDNADWKVPKAEEAWDDEFHPNDLEPYDADLEAQGRQARAVQSPVQLSRYSVHGHNGAMSYPVQAHTYSRPPMSNPHVPESLQNACGSSPMAAFSGPGVAALSLAALRPTGLGQLSSGECNNRALGRTMLDLAAKEGAQERPLDIAAWCSQQANISQSHACGSEGGSLEVATRRPGIAPSNEESGGYLRMHRGRGALLKQPGPLRKPGTGFAAGWSAGEAAAAAHDNTENCPEPALAPGAQAEATAAPHLGPHARCANGLSSARADRSARQPREDGGREVDRSSVEVYARYSARSTTPPPSPTVPAGELEAESRARQRCPSDQGAGMDRRAVSHPEERYPVLAAATVGGQPANTRLSNSGGVQSQRRVDSSPPTGHSADPRSAPRRVSSQPGNVTRIRNIEKLLAAIESISMKLSQGMQLDSNQTAMLARRSVLEAERDSLLN